MNTVRIISPDWAAVRSALTAWAEALVCNREVLGVLLFGSLARGDHAPGSDADLIVVVRRSLVPPERRPDSFPGPGTSIPADITVYTEEELGQLVDERLPFLRRALSEGRWLATAPGWDPPRAPEEAG